MLKCRSLSETHSLCTRWMTQSFAFEQVWSQSNSQILNGFVCPSAGTAQRIAQSVLYRDHCPWAWDRSHILRCPAGSEILPVAFPLGHSSSDSTQLLQLVPLLNSNFGKLRIETESLSSQPARMKRNCKKWWGVVVKCSLVLGGKWW